MLATGACTSDEWPPNADDDGASTGDEPELVGPRLSVYEPQSPSIHYVGEPMPLLAELYDADGLVIGFDEIVWNADAVGPALHIGAEGEVELTPGLYEIIATASLPGGDRVSSTIGGVRVQTRWTGNYSGDAILALAVELQGIPLAPTCVGPLELRVDYDGESIEVQDGTCSLNAIITTFDVVYTIDGEFDNGVGRGTIDYEIAGLFTLTFEWSGAFVEDGFRGGFAGPVSIPLVGTAEATGTLYAPLTSPWLDVLP
ncbi:MAG: hypothetical protein IAG13_03515 [Deltaproteobacteria bacterium]|nr:hypothetical protein [Nannocystaceae bacterium]